MLECRKGYHFGSKMMFRRDFLLWVDKRIKICPSVFNTPVLQFSSTCFKI